VAQKPNIRTAGVDLVFLLITLIAGWLNAPLWGAGAIIAAAVAAWGLTRRRALARMTPQRRAAQAAIALGMLVGVLAFFYWIGLTFGGHT
jgi:hypothetical protein